MDEYSEHLEKILAKNLLPQRTSRASLGMKVIHDPIWGSQLYYPWEIALIDTPLCQRLRRIYQLGTAYLTYPSAVHTRFSHSLGVTALAGRLINRLKEKERIKRKAGIKITENDIYTVRLAGLLHDVGHCFFSHASERVIGLIIDDYRKELIPSVKPKPHEFIAYLIITNDYFKKYWEKHIKQLFPSKNATPDLQDIANIIVGISPSEEKRFLREILYGPYDVDKLEYLYRDARTTGLEITYDIERYFYKIMLNKSDSGSWRLFMDQGGVRAVEQIIFSKMMLFSFVYHHQKVLASDALISDIVTELIKGKSNGSIKIVNLLDFLLYTDSDILSSGLNEESNRYTVIRNKIFNRELPKRCFVINKEFVVNLAQDEDVKRNWDRLLDDLRGLPEDVEIIREEIVKIINEQIEGKDATIDDLLIVFPKVPAMDEQACAPVVGTDGRTLSMSDFFDFQGWKTTYDLKKLRGYFFSTQKYQKIASYAIEKYLEEKYKLQFTNHTKIEAKIDPRDVKKHS